MTVHVLLHLLRVNILLLRAVVYKKMADDISVHVYCLSVSALCHFLYTNLLSRGLIPVQSAGCYSNDGYYCRV